MKTYMYLCDDFRISAQTKSVVTLLITGLFSALLSGCGSSKLPGGPPLSSVATWDASPEFEVLSNDELAEWLASETPVDYINTPENLLPNGLAACMTPFLVDWKGSLLETNDQGFVLIRNVQVGGNPILGNSRNASVRIPVRAVERIEYVIVRYYLKGFAKYSGHVQIRFIFKEDRRPCILDTAGNPDLNHPLIDDLILSWEAWRPPLTGYSFTKGLDPKDGYRLTARLYAGSQRFLNDSLRGAVWDCYPLELPMPERANDMVLFSGLIMGDAVGRRTISEMLEEGLLKDDSGQLASQWSAKGLEKARGRLDWEQIPDDMLKDYMKDADISYHTFSRSCISVTQAQIEVAAERLYDEENLGPRKPVDFDKGEIPKWFDDVRDENSWGIIKGAPGALFWIMGHKDLLPYKSYTPLQDAGLLKLDKKGKNPEVYRYGHKEANPYGDLKRNLM